MISAETIQGTNHKTISLRNLPIMLHCSTKTTHPKLRWGPSSPTHLSTTQKPGRPAQIRQASKTRREEAHPGGCEVWAGLPGRAACERSAEDQKKQPQLRRRQRPGHEGQTKQRLSLSPAPKTASLAKKKNELSGAAVLAALPSSSRA